MLGSKSKKCYLGLLEIQSNLIHSPSLNKQFWNLFFFEAGGREMIEVINISSNLIKTVSGINPFNYQLMEYKVIYLTATLKVAYCYDWERR